MRPSAWTAALATLALGFPARSQGGPGAFLAGPPDAEVEIEADHMDYAWETQLLKLKGHVVARRGGGILRAESGTWDRANGLLSLEGGVLGVQARQVFLADSALVDLNAHSADLKSAVLYLKEQPANPNAPKAGKNALILHGQHVKQREDGAYQAEDVTITPCDCAQEPDYELLAHSALLDEDRAHLSGTRMHFLGATLPLFPLALPMHSRQWGLLAPQWGYDAISGFAYQQPVFVPLGDSYDFTLTPGWSTGGSGLKHDPTTLPSQYGIRTVRGPRLGAEFRWAPWDGTSGALSLDLFDDLDQRDSKGLPPDTSPGRGIHGVRGLAHLTERSEGSAGVLAVQGEAATDLMVLNDVQPLSPDRILDALRTDFGAWSARGPLTVGADATLLQDMRIDNGAEPDRRLYGAEARSTFQRLPGVFAQVAPTQIGPGLFSMEASAVQFAALKAPTQVERDTGFAPDEGSGPSLGGDVSRAPALRFDVAPRLYWDTPAVVPVDLRLDAGARADAWLTEGYPDRDRTRAYAMAGARASLPLERGYDGALLHRLEPAVQVRAITQPLQSGGPPIGDPTDAGGATYAMSPAAAQQGLVPGGTIAGVPAERRAYDEIDGAAPASGEVETVFSLSQSLWTKAGARAVRMVQLDLSQDVLLWTRGAHSRLGEAMAVAGLSLGPFGADATLRYDWAERAISILSASARLRDGRSDELHFSTTLLRASSSERTRAGIDELFSAVRLAAVPGSDQYSGNIGLGGSAPLLWNFKLAYDLTRTLSSTPLLEGWPDLMQIATLSYETSCHCAGLLLRAVLPMHGGHVLGGPQIGFVIDLKQLGSISPL